MHSIVESGWRVDAKFIASLVPRELKSARSFIARIRRTHPQTRPRGDHPPPPHPPATMSKFTVRRHLHNGRDDWSPYDLLGLFLSFMGPAPGGATKRNFYLPMTAVYGRWCRQIAGSYPRNTICDSPFMFQCTWCIPF